jgi:hypothetical protein
MRNTIILAAALCFVACDSKEVDQKDNSTEKTAESTEKSEEKPAKADDKKEEKADGTGETGKSKDEKVKAEAPAK